MNRGIPGLGRSMLSESSPLLRGRSQQTHHLEPCLLLRLADLPEDPREHVVLMSRQPLFEVVTRGRKTQALGSTVGLVDRLGDQPPLGEFAQWCVHRLLADAEGGAKLVDAEIGRLRDEVEDAVVYPRQAAAWNAHDLDRILEHYAEEVEFSSPFYRGHRGMVAETFHFDDTGRVRQAIACYGVEG